MDADADLRFPTCAIPPRRRRWKGRDNRPALDAHAQSLMGRQAVAPRKLAPCSFRFAPQDAASRCGPDAAIGSDCNICYVAGAGECGFPVRRDAGFHITVKVNGAAREKQEEGEQQSAASFPQFFCAAALFAEEPKDHCHGLFLHVYRYGRPVVRPVGKNIGNGMRRGLPERNGNQNKEAVRMPGRFQVDGFAPGQQRLDAGRVVAAFQFQAEL